MQQPQYFLACKELYYHFRPTPAATSSVPEKYKEYDEAERFFLNSLFRRNLAVASLCRSGQANSCDPGSVAQSAPLIQLPTEQQRTDLQTHRRLRST